LDPVYRYSLRNLETESNLEGKFLQDLEKHCDLDDCIVSPKKPMRQMKGDVENSPARPL
jgi:hypothetical protein